MADELIPNGNNVPDPKKVEFTPEQQEKVNEFIDKAVGRATAKVRAEVATQLETAQADLRTAREALATATTPAARAEAKGDIATLQATIEEMKNASKSSTQDIERLKGEVKAKVLEAQAAVEREQSVRKDVAITSAASKSANFMDLDAIKKLTQDSIKQEDGKWVVLNESGQPRLNAAMEPMTLAEFYNDYAAKNPWTVRGDVRPGTGATESARSTLTNNGKFEVKQIFGKESNAALANKLARENPGEYKRLKTVAKEAGLI